MKNNLIIILIGIAFVGCGTDEREEQIQKAVVGVIENVSVEDSFQFIFNESYKVKVLEGYSLVNISEKASLISSADSSGANVVFTILKEPITLEQFEVDFQANNNTFKIIGEVIRKDYKNGNYMETADVSFSKKGMNYNGVIFIVLKSNKCFLIQGSSLELSWENESEDIYDIIDSYFILNK